MQTAQLGDRVQVHYVKRLQDGATASSRGRAPLEVTVGVDHPRLPGLGRALVGLSLGASTTIHVPAGSAYAAPDAARVRRWARARFPKDQPLPVGQWGRVVDRRGRHRSVRILEVLGNIVVIDTNHRGAGQALELEVELVGIGGADTAPPELRLLLKAIAFDVDADSLASLRQAFPGWEVEEVGGATLSSLDQDWNPGVAHLLVIGARDQPGKALRMCRALRSQAGRAQTPLLVLLRLEQEALATAALEAGADSCLVLPLQGKDLAGVLSRAQAGNRPGRHTLHQDRPQRPDEWQDEGGGG